MFSSAETMKYVLRSNHACQVSNFIPQQIRLFGDPLFNRGRTGVPMLSLTLKVDVEPELSIPTVTRMPSHDVSCDLVNGWAFGEALGVGLRSQSGWWTVKNVSLFKEGSGVSGVFDTNVQGGISRLFRSHWNWWMRSVLHLRRHA